MKTKEEILTPEKFYAAGNYPEMKDKFDMSAKIFDYYSMTQFAHDYASHLSERVKELDQNNAYLNSWYKSACDDLIRAEARIKELEKYNDQLICAAHDSELKFKELESQQQPVKEDEVFLMHLVDVVACFTAEQNMFYATNVRKELIAKARERFSSPPNQNVKE